MTDRHPWVHLGRLLPGFAQPRATAWTRAGKTWGRWCARWPGPTRPSNIGIDPTDLWFESVEEILELYGRRLLIGPERWDELMDLLEPDIVTAPTVSRSAARAGTSSPSGGRRRLEPSIDNLESSIRPGEHSDRRVVRVTVPTPTQPVVEPCS